MAKSRLTRHWCARRSSRRESRGEVEGFENWVEGPLCIAARVTSWLGFESGGDDENRWRGEVSMRNWMFPATSYLTHDANPRSVSALISVPRYCVHLFYDYDEVSCCGGICQQHKRVSASLSSVWKIRRPRRRVSEYIILGIHWRIWNIKQSAIKSPWIMMNHST